MNLRGVETDHIGVEGSDAMAHLVEGIRATISVHLIPRLLLEDAGGGGDLGNDVEGVLLEVLHHDVEGAVVSG